MAGQRKWFFEMESSPGEGTAKIIEMTIKDLKYYINLVDKAVAGLKAGLKWQGFFPVLKEVLLWIETVKQHCTFQRNCS